MDKFPNDGGPKHCAYCDQAGRSREHYFPQWMHPFLGQLPRQMFRSTDTHYQDENGRIDDGASTKRLGRPLVKDVERRVCGPCNSGWMSRLTEAAKPALERVLFGNPETIDVEAQRLIAKWVAMTIMTIEVGQRYPGVEPGERRRFRDDQQVPDDWRIWMARYQGDNWNAAYHRHGAVAEFDQGPTSVLTGFVMALGNACFFAMAGATPSPDFIRSLKESGWASVHPAEAPIPWASLPALPDEVLDAAAAFITAEGDRMAEQVAAAIAPTTPDERRN